MSQGGLRDFDVIEVKLLGTDDLIVLVALAGDENDVTARRG